MISHHPPKQAALETTEQRPRRPNRYGRSFSSGSGGVHVGNGINGVKREAGGNRGSLRHRRSSAVNTGGNNGKNNDKGVKRNKSRDGRANDNLTSSITESECDDQFDTNDPHFVSNVPENEEFVDTLNPDDKAGNNAESSGFGESSDAFDSPDFSMSFHSLSALEHSGNSSTDFRPTQQSRFNGHVHSSSELFQSTPRSSLRGSNTSGSSCGDDDISPDPISTKNYRADELANRLLKFNKRNTYGNDDGPAQVTPPITPVTPLERERVIIDLNSNNQDSSGGKILMPPPPPPLRSGTSRRTKSASNVNTGNNRQVDRPIQRRSSLETSEDESKTHNNSLSVTDLMGSSNFLHNEDADEDNKKNNNKPNHVLSSFSPRPVKVHQFVDDDDQPATKHSITTTPTLRKPTLPTSILNTLHHIKDATTNSEKSSVLSAHQTANSKTSPFVENSDKGEADNNGNHSNTVPNSESLPDHVDKKGRCIRHPLIKLYKKKLLGGYEMIRDVCPNCEKEAPYEGLWRSRQVKGKRWDANHTGERIGDGKDRQEGIAVGDTINIHSLNSIDTNDDASDISDSDMNFATDVGPKFVPPPPPARAQSRDRRAVRSKSRERGADRSLQPPPLASKPLERRSSSNGRPISRSFRQDRGDICESNRLETRPSSAGRGIRNFQQEKEDSMAPPLKHNRFERRSSSGFSSSFRIENEDVPPPKLNSLERKSSLPGRIGNPTPQSQEQPDMPTPPVEKEEQSSNLNVLNRLHRRSSNEGRGGRSTSRNCRSSSSVPVHGYKASSPEEKNDSNETQIEDGVLNMSLGELDKLHLLDKPGGRGRSSSRPRSSKSSHSTNRRGDAGRASHLEDGGQNNSASAARAPPPPPPSKTHPRSKSKPQQQKMSFCKKTGRCKAHPSVIVARKKLRGGGWEFIRDHCPHCATEAASKKGKDSGQEPVKESREFSRRRSQSFHDDELESSRIDIFSEEFRSGQNKKAPAPPKSQSFRDSSSEKVAKMPYVTPWGESGWYTGEVNSAGKPHGKGRIRFKTGSHFEGQWTDGYSEQYLENRGRLKSGFGSNIAPWKKSKESPSVKNQQSSTSVPPSSVQYPPHAAVPQYGLAYVPVSQEWSGVSPVAPVQVANMHGMPPMPNMGHHPAYPPGFQPM